MLFCQPTADGGECFHCCSLYTVGLTLTCDADDDTWFLYLIRTADNKLYTGITTDVERRYQQHQSGKGAKALRGKGELTLAFSAPVGDRSLALRAEYRVKQLTKRQRTSGSGRRRVCRTVEQPANPKG